jgi:hypothetical protein
MPSPTPGGQTGPQKFDNYTGPVPLPHNVQSVGVVILIGEPSLGVDWVTNNTMYAGYVDTFRIKFDYGVKPPTATWNDATATVQGQATLDTRLITDHTGAFRSTDDRTVVANLAGAQSAEFFSDDDGASPNPPDWITSSGGGFPSGVDHESIGAGPYAPAPGLPTPAYPHAVYYCSQNLTGAFCARSDDGAATWGAGTSAFQLNGCGGLSGKLEIGPDGTVYLPNRDCNGQQALITSKDNGLTWTTMQIPGTSTDANSSLDPGFAIGGTTGTGTLYYGYRDANHHADVVTSSDGGAHWSAPFDVGAAWGIQNAQFATMTAGDQNRAAFSFIGTTTPGDDQPDSFPGVWYLFTAFTYDGGKTWDTVIDTPNDPVQRGGVCAGGTGCSGSDRNMLDFNDSTIDNQGRVQVAYTDGCSGACETNASAPTCNNGDSSCTGTFSSVYSVVDQVCGMGLLAASDPGFNNDPNCPPTTNIPESTGTSMLVIAGGAAATVIALVSATRRRRRRTSARS